MGGTVPLGYQVQDRKLIVKDPEASFVSGLFARYLELRSVPAVAAEVTRQAVVNEQISNSDRGLAGYSRRVGSGMLYKLLANPIYIGKLRHRGNVYAGEHHSIVDADLFMRVQELLASQAATPRGSRTQADVHLLTGLLFDDSDDRMSPSHAKARGKRFRYYISSRIRKRGDGTAWRVPAPVIEAVVLDFGARLLSDQARLSDWIHLHAPSCNLQLGLDQAKLLGARLADEAEPQRRAVLGALFHKIILASDAITFEVNTATLVRLLVPESATRPSPPQDDVRCDSPVAITLQIKIKRRGNEMRMVIDGETKSQNPDATLVNLVARAHVYLECMTAQPSLSISDIANQFGVHRADVGRLLPLAFLSPRVLEQILSGRQPADLTARRLARLNLPLAWSDQANIFATWQ